jgi:hypothetical protein
VNATSVMGLHCAERKNQPGTAEEREGTGILSLQIGVGEALVRYRMAANLGQGTLPQGTHKGAGAEGERRGEREREREKEGARSRQY